MESVFYSCGWAPTVVFIRSMPTCRLYDLHDREQGIVCGAEAYGEAMLQKNRIGNQPKLFVGCMLLSCVEFNAADLSYMCAPLLCGSMHERIVRFSLFLPERVPVG